MSCSKLVTTRLCVVDSFPILKIVPSWFPGAGFQKKAQDMKKLTEEVRTVAFKHVQKQVVGEFVISENWVIDLSNRPMEPPFALMLRVTLNRVKRNRPQKKPMRYALSLGTCISVCDFFISITLSTMLKSHP